MNTLNLKITNQDFGLENKEYSENFRTRYASRGIVFDPKTNKVAMVVKTKIHQCKLPGGGKEDDETPEETFEREIFEETGCKIKIIKKIGTVIDEPVDIDIRQISTAFISELIEDTKEIHPTQKELDEGIEVQWLDVETAINLVKKTIDSAPEDLKYRIRFTIKRDVKILEFFKQDFLGQD